MSCLPRLPLFTLRLECLPHRRLASVVLKYGTRRGRGDAELGFFLFRQVGERTRECPESTPDLGMPRSVFHTLRTDTASHG